MNSEHGKKGSTKSSCWNNNVIREIYKNISLVIMFLKIIGFNDS